MARKAQHDYEALREAYRLTPVTLSDKEFATKMKIPLRTFQDKKRKDAKAGEPWERDLTGAVKTHTRQMQQRVAAGLDKNEPITDEAIAIATAATTNFLVLERHGELFETAIKRIGDGMELLKGHIDQGFIVVNRRGPSKDGQTTEEVDVSAEYVGKTMNALASSLERVVKMQRHHIGVDDEDGGASYEDDLEALAASMDDDVE
jgi:hypothetical protein